MKAYVQQWDGGPDRPGPGLFVAGMDEGVYHAGPEISKSGLDLIEKSPAHYAQREQKEPTPAMRMGTAIHRALLEPERFEAEYVVVDAKDRRQKAYKDAVLEHGVELVLLPHEHDNLRAIQRAAFERPMIESLLKALGHRELSAFAKDPVTGVVVRCRYDLLGAGFAVDLKKSRDVFERGFSRAVASYRYHVQVALYSDVYKWLTGEELEAFWLVAIEETPPYTIVPYRLDDIAIEAGRLAYRRNLNTFAECLASGHWPTYEPESSLLTLPEWATHEIDEELLTA